MENTELAALLAAMQEQIAGLASAVSGLVERAHNPSGHLPDTAPPDPRTLSPLVSSERYGPVWTARYQLAHRFNLPQDAANVLADLGARGLYRSSRGFKLIREQPHDFKLALVEDAMLEDAEEAKQMGADLLKVWDAPDTPSW